MSDTTFNHVIERARQHKMLEDFARNVMVVGSSENVGTWFPPPGMENAHFVRCGKLHPDGSMPPVCAEVYRLHTSMGASDKGIRGMRPPAGFEGDDGKGVYVWYYPESWEEIKTMKARIQYAKDNRDKRAEFASEIGHGASSVEITATSGTGIVKTRK